MVRIGKLSQPPETRTRILALEAAVVERGLSRHATTLFRIRGRLWTKSWGRIVEEEVM